MYNLDKAYSKKFFAQRKSLAWRIPIICDAIIEVLKPKSVIDIGCGNGDLVKGFNDRSITAFGVEGTFNSWYGINGNKNIYIHDLRLPYNIDIRKFDLAICFEVAEHIEPEYVDIFLDNLCLVSNKILFSAAGPGQKGIYHHNCQPREYWYHKLMLREYKNNLNNPYCRDIVLKLKNMWYSWRNKKGIKAYYQNLMYFEKKINMLK